MAIQRDEFMKYLFQQGYEGPGAYCSILLKVEEIFNVDIDAEYDKDKCETLLQTLKEAKKNPEAIGKKDENIRNFISKVNKYIEFKNVSNGIEIKFSPSSDTLLRALIEDYRNNFVQIHTQEKYKWEAIAWYKQHWDINATNFAEMIKNSYSKADNLLSGANYYPLAGIIEFATAQPEAVRQLFKIIHNETLDLAVRFSQFQNKIKSYYELQGKSGYADLHAFSVYLTFEYPEKYFFYKYKVVKNFAKNIEININLDSVKNEVDKILISNKICEKIKLYITHTLKLIYPSVLDDNCYQDNNLNMLAFNIMYYGSNTDIKTVTELQQKQMNTLDNTSITNISKNTILYGPPGTGKTYHSICYAVAIVENKTIEDVLAEDYEEVFERYTTYKYDGLIEFVTFHQSYGYEEFIEGIKPVIESDDEEKSDINYSIEGGIFKNFCEKASRPVLKEQKQHLGLNNSPTIWKVSLEGTGDNPTRAECMENGHIRIGYDGYGPEITSDTNFNEGGKNVVNALIYKMRKGDIIFSCYSASTIDAIGVVTGEYEWHNEYDHYKRVRKVNWIVKDIQEDIIDINNGAQMTLSSVYKLNINLSDAMALIQKYTTNVIEENKNHVFIIDEINRGNISKIFGELITLIEESKRIGAKEETKAKLPYSQKSFGVPNNVYILGTMNTADRSIAALDTALRRRFSFVEMMPDADVLNEVSVEDINIKKMLKKINERIEVLFDREHTIGHAYFINLIKNPDIETLADIFKNKIIPLLQEYFYEDYEKIRLVLADNQTTDQDKQFILKSSVDIEKLFGGDAIEILDDAPCYSINEKAFNNKEAYIKIY